MNTKIYKKKRTKTYLLIIVVFLVVSCLIFLYLSHLWPFSYTQSNVVDNTTASPINYSPPTEKETKDGQETKKQSYNNSSTNGDGDTQVTPQSNNTDKKAVSIAVSYADINSENQLEIRAYTSDIIEGSGTCTATITNGTTTLMASTPAFIDVSSSICEPIYFSRDRLAAGEWTIKVSYSSPDATGVSGPEKVTIK